MKRKILFMLCLIVAGTFAYFGGYYLYRSSNPKVEILEPESLQRTVQISDTSELQDREYYVGKIEQDLLVIYKMPEETVYDSIEISSLRFFGDEESRLMEGMVFQNLTEVFEFLENSMS